MKQHGINSKRGDKVVIVTDVDEHTDSEMKKMDEDCSSI